MLVLAVLVIPSLGLAETWTYYWNESEGSTILGYRFRGEPAHYGWDFYQSDLRCYYGGSGEADFLLAVIAGLQPGDQVSFVADTWSNYIGDIMYVGGYLGGGALDFSVAPDSYPALVVRADGNIDTGPITILPGYTEFAICLSFNYRSLSFGWYMIDHLTMTYPEHARLTLPSGVVASSARTWGKVKTLYR